MQDPVTTQSNSSGEVSVVSPTPEEVIAQGNTDRAQAWTAITLLTTAIAASRPRPRIDYFLTERAVQSLAELSDSEFVKRLRENVLHNGMVPNISNLSLVVDLSRSATYSSHISGIAYYDHEISPGVNHEPVRIDLRYEDSRWLIDSWRQG